jgi:DNA-binding CsgD family transcriptional regulator
LTSRALRETSRVIIEIARSSSSDELRARFAAFCESIGYENYSVGSRRFVAGKTLDKLWATNVPANYTATVERFPQWHRAYFATFDWRKPIIWRTDFRFLRGEIRRLFDFSESIGERCCLSVPLVMSNNYVEGVRLTSSRLNLVEDEHIHALISVSQVFRLKLELLEKIYSPELDDPRNPLVALTDKQIEVVRWIRAGKSNTDIATIMNLPVRTIRYHVSEIIRKLGVATRAQAAGFLPRPHD